MATNFTTSDLEALEKAIATGARRVKFADREVEYQSMDDMLKARNLIRKALGVVDTSSGTRVYPSFSKGTC